MTWLKSKSFGILAANKIIVSVKSYYIDLVISVRQDYHIMAAAGSISQDLCKTKVLPVLPTTAPLQSAIFHLIKFMFSKKATKIDAIFTVDLTLCSKRQIDGEDFVNICGLLRKYEL